jgi:hypothetical protein
MRRLISVLLAAAISATAGTALADGKIRLAQTSNVTNCMMICNSAAANCRTTCLVPGTPPTTAATTTSNASANLACVLNCSSTQQACHIACGQQSPSQ